MMMMSRCEGKKKPTQRTLPFAHLREDALLYSINRRVNNSITNGFADDEFDIIQRQNTRIALRALQRWTK